MPCKREGTRHKGLENAHPKAGDFNGNVDLRKVETLGCGFEEAVPGRVDAPELGDPSLVLVIGVYRWLD